MAASHEKKQTKDDGMRRTSYNDHKGMQWTWIAIGTHVPLVQVIRLPYDPLVKLSFIVIEEQQTACLLQFGHCRKVQGSSDAKSDSTGDNLKLASLLTSVLVSTYDRRTTSPRQLESP